MMILLVREPRIHGLQAPQQLVCTPECHQAQKTCNSRDQTFTSLLPTYIQERKASENEHKK